MKPRNLNRSLLCIAICALAASAEALVSSPPVRVTDINTYTDFGNGDVVFTVDTAVSSCDGYWLSPADPGFKNAYAALLMVKATDSAVVLYAYETQLWPGSASGKFCRIRSITPK